MTKIPWATHTINPFVGCTPISTGCRHCYAAKMACRLRRLPGYGDVTEYGRWTGRIGVRLKEAKAQLDRVRSGTVFWCSMGDLFHPAIDTRDRDTVLGWMLKRTDLRHLVLTKRPAHAREYYRDIAGDTAVFDGLESPLETSEAFHIWLGVTAENQTCANRRIPTLLRIPAYHRFVSLEPLLGPIGLPRHWLRHPYDMADGENSHKRKLDWVIVGGESLGCNPGRVCELAWVRDIVSQCIEAGVPVMVKQLVIDGELVRLEHGFGRQRIAEALGFEPSQIAQWPESIINHQSSIPKGGDAVMD